MSEEETNVEVAGFLEAWFRLYELYLCSEPINERDLKALRDWGLECSSNWNGMRNLSERIAQWIEKWAPDTNLDSSPLFIISSTVLWIPSNNDVLNAAWNTCRKLQARVGTLEGAAFAKVLSDMLEGTQEPQKDANATDEYSSKQYTPSELRKLFEVNQDTLRNRLKEQKIRNVKITTKAYRIHKDDLPSTED